MSRQGNVEGYLNQLKNGLRESKRKGIGKSGGSSALCMGL